MLLPPGVAVALGLFGGRLARGLPPATAVRLLTVAAVVTALATGFVLGVAGFLTIAQVPLVARLGHWSIAAIGTGDPLTTAAGLLAGIAMVLLAASALRRLVLSGRQLTAAALICRRLGPAAEGLVILDDEAPDAYALPGVRGRIVVSTAMLRALAADERRVLLAHEAAHLTHRHHVYLHLSELAAAANPLLRPLARAVRVAVERWADEVAAAEVGNRRLAARALARAGLARAGLARDGLARDGQGGGQIPAAALPAAEGGLAERTRALLAGPPRPRRALTALVAALVLASTAAAVETAHDTEHRFELAQALYIAPR